MQEIKVNLAERAYSVFIGDLPKLKFENKVAIVTNQKVGGLHLKTLLSRLEAPEIFTVSVPDGERYKNLTTIEAILEQLFVSRLSRKDALIALGGGVVSDMTGFAASIYERGIDFINIPTTLLSQVDASVGGKTGVNNRFGKNLVGTFFQPRAVYCDPAFLATLPPREFRAGLAEVVKIAATFDAEFFAFLESCDLTNPEHIHKIIAKCVEIKARVVELDEREGGLRAALNYGHTFAHVIENETNYDKFLHGEAVAMGICMANDLAVSLGDLDKKSAERIKNLLIKFELPTRYEIADAARFYDAFTLDKKSAGGKIKFILTGGKIGSHLSKSDVSRELVLDVLRGYQKGGAK